MYNYRLKACRRCGGDLARDEGDWICLQCGSYSYVNLYRDSEMPLSIFLDRSSDSRLPEEFSQPGQNGSSSQRQWHMRVILHSLSNARTGRPVQQLSCPVGLP